MFEESVLLECRCTADPVPSFTWTLDGKTIAAGPRYKQGILSEGNTHTIFLEIGQLTAKDSGAYKVTAKNVKGDGAANIQLNIEGIDFRLVEERARTNPTDVFYSFVRLPEGIAPSFLSKPTMKQDAKTVTVQIDIIADPSPSLHWTKDGKELLNVDKIITRMVRQGGNKYTISLDIKVREREKGFVQWGQRSSSRT
jgi:hypothetical protein